MSCPDHHARAALLRLVALLCLCQAACAPAEVEEPYYTEQREACGHRDPRRNLYFGDLHLHTALSFDANAWGNRASLAQAYAFARGKALALPPRAAPRTVRLSRPLDFAALSDHSEFLGEVRLCTRAGSTAYGAAACQKFRKGDMGPVMSWAMQMAGKPPLRNKEVCGSDLQDCVEAATRVWADIVDAADAAYDRSASCRFTAFAAYEYTSAPAMTNVHRNIIFRTTETPVVPTSSFELQTPEALWTTLEQRCQQAPGSCDFIAIPHNSNWSNGKLFALPAAEQLTAAQRQAAARRRARLEPLVEMMQHKGSMECKNGFAGVPTDPHCDFEELRPKTFADCKEGAGWGAMIGMGCVSRYDYVRNVLKRGLAQQLALGVNPFKLGVIGGTDSHNATAGKTEEYDFVGHMGITDDTPDERLKASYGASYNTPAFNPGGLMAVWAEENSRDALFRAFRRREVYSTSGTRIAVRLFGGWGLESGLCQREDWLARADQGGVPMGSDLPPGRGGAPVFVVRAVKDAGTAAHPGVDLQQIQLIKGWIDARGSAHEKVIRVAGSAKSGASVDPKSCKPQGKGAETLCAVWTDPAFDARRPAFYYARVLENPSCSWRQHDCNSYAAGVTRPAACSQDSVARVIQERAVTSAIFYTP